MALYIAERLGAEGGGGRAGERAQAEGLEGLEGLPEVEQQSNALLKRCGCRMTTSMKCGCSAGQPGGTGEAMRYNTVRLRQTRRQMGGVPLEPERVTAAVEGLGGVAAVEAQQGKPGRGWKQVAAALGVDVERSRDAGYQAPRRPRTPHASLPASLPGAYRGAFLKKLFYKAFFTPLQVRKVFYAAAAAAAAAAARARAAAGLEASSCSVDVDTATMAPRDPPSLPPAGCGSPAPAVGGGGRRAAALLGGGGDAMETG